MKNQFLIFTIFILSNIFLCSAGDPLRYLDNNEETVLKEERSVNEPINDPYKLYGPRLLEGDGTDVAFEEVEKVKVKLMHKENDLEKIWKSIDDTEKVEAKPYHQTSKESAVEYEDVQKVAIKPMTLIGNRNLDEIADVEKVPIKPMHQINNSNVTLPVISNCYEEDPPTICVSKPNCCHVSSYYSTYLYRGCIDVMTPTNYQSFCSKFVELNRADGYTASACSCMNYIHNVSSSSFLTTCFNLVLLIMILSF